MASGKASSAVRLREEVRRVSEGEWASPVPGVPGAEPEQNRRLEVKMLEDEIAKLRAQIGKEKEAAAAQSAGEQIASSGEGRFDPLPASRLAEERRRKAFEQVGGEAAVRDHMGISADISRAINKTNTTYGQDRIYAGLNVDCLLRHAELALNELHDRCEEFKEFLNKSEYQLEVTIERTPVKGNMRSTSKVNVKYGGNLCQLSDAARLSLLIGYEKEDGISKLYRAVHEFVTSPDSKIQFSYFDDRFLQPLAEGYRDFLFAVSSAGVQCEVQVNFKSIRDVARRGGHQAYETSRLANVSLLEAAQKNDLGAVRHFVNQGAAIDYKTNDGFTALSYAALHGNAAIASYLLDEKADPFHLDMTETLPIKRAVDRAPHSKNHWDTTQSLIEGMLQRVADYQKPLPVNVGVKRSVVQTWASMEEEHLRTKAREAKKGNDTGYHFPEQLRQFRKIMERTCGGLEMAFAIAVMSGDVVSIGAILKSNPDAASMRLPLDDSWVSSLDLAVKYGHKGIVRMLVSKKGELDAYSRMKTEEKKSKYKAVKDYIIDEDAGHVLDAALEADAHWLSPVEDRVGSKPENMFDPSLTEFISSCCKTGNSNSLPISVISTLLRRGADAHRLDRVREVPLILQRFVSEKDSFALRLLMERRADICGKSPSEEEKDVYCCLKPLLLATSMGQIDNIRALANHENSRNLLAGGDCEGQTAMHSAASHGHFEIVQFLVSQRCDISKANKRGRTPMCEAARGGHSDLLKKVSAANFENFDIKQPAFTSESHNEGHGLIAAAAYAGQVETITMLVSLGCDVNQRSERGDLPAHLAAYEGVKTSLERLAEHGSQFNQPNKQFEYPWHCFKNHLAKKSGSGGGVASRRELKTGTYTIDNGDGMCLMLGSDGNVCVCNNPDNFTKHVADAGKDRPIEIEKVHATHWRIAMLATTTITINPPESARSYSSVYSGDSDNDAGGDSNGDTIGTGYAQSMLDSPLAWSPAQSEVGQWMQIDAQASRSILGVVIQGRANDGHSDECVSRFKVKVSSDGRAWTDVPGDFDIGIEPEVRFPSIQTARYVRIYPQKWNKRVSMRAGLLVETASGLCTIESESAKSQKKDATFLAISDTISVDGRAAIVLSDDPEDALAMWVIDKTGGVCTIQNQGADCKFLNSSGGSTDNGAACLLPDKVNKIQWQLHWQDEMLQTLQEWHRRQAGARPLRVKKAMVYDEVKKRDYWESTFGKKTARARRFALFTAGIPGSGKSTVIPFALEKMDMLQEAHAKNYVELNKDDILLNMFDNDNDQFDNASGIYKEVRDEAVAEGYNLVIDGTGRYPPNLSDTVAMIKQSDSKMCAGGSPREFVLLIVICPVGEAIIRSNIRANETKRKVDEKFIQQCWEGTHDNIKEYLNTHKYDYDHIFVFDNCEARESGHGAAKAPARLIYHKGHTETESIRPGHDHWWASELNELTVACNGENVKQKEGRSL